jgi:hypothetical protein
LLQGQGRLPLHQRIFLGVYLTLGQALHNGQGFGVVGLGDGGQGIEGQQTGA